MTLLTLLFDFLGLVIFSGLLLGGVKLGCLCRDIYLLLHRQPLILD